MTDEHLRRDILRAGIFIGSIGISGCLSTSSGDHLNVRNHDEESHSVTVCFNRGEADDIVCKTTSLNPNTEKKYEDFIPSSDYNYTYFLVIYIDGVPIKTVEQQWNGNQVTVTVKSENSVNVYNQSNSS